MTVWWWATVAVLAGYGVVYAIATGQWGALPLTAAGLTGALVETRDARSRTSATR